jgi:hypothetical protein
MAFRVWLIQFESSDKFWQINFQCYFIELAFPSLSLMVSVLEAKKKTTLEGIITI